MGRYPRDVLNEYRWRKGYGLERLTVEYRHGGADGGFLVIPGSSITEMDSMFFYKHDGTAIPYHRILRIKDGESVVFDLEKERSTPPPS